MSTEKVVYMYVQKRLSVTAVEAGILWAFQPNAS